MIFNTSKQELGNPGSNLKKFVKKYKDSYKVKNETFRSDLTRMQSITKKSKRPTSSSSLPPKIASHLPKSKT